MNAWRQSARELADSPNLGRDLATLLSSWRLAVWYSALMFLILATLGISLLVLHNSGSGEMTARLGLGQYVAVLQFLAVTAFLTAFVPLRCSGVFEGPRWQRYFDQIVLSGISPTRYLAGKVVGANVFFVTVLAATVPFLIFTVGLGGVSPGYVAAALATLWLYANLLIFSTLCAGVFASELLSTAAVIGLFGFLFIVGLFPLPPLVGLWSPAHLLVAPFYAAADRPEANELALVFGGLRVGLGNVPVFVTGAIVLGGFEALFVLLGPLRCFTLPTSTFGEVVMRGDAKRSRFARNRPELQRRTEMCFFYENRPAWLDRHEVPLRWGGLVAIVLLTTGALFLMPHANVGSLNNDAFFVINALLFCLLIGLATIVFSNDHSTEKALVAWGARRFRAGTVDTLAFLLVAGVILGAAFGLPALREAVSGGTWLRGGRSGTRLAYTFLFLAPLFLLFVLEYYALVRLFGLLFWSRTGGWLGATAVFAVGIVLVPLGLGMLLAEGSGGLLAALPVARLVGAWIAWLSPVVPIMMTVDPGGAPSELKSIHGWGLAVNIALHLGLFLMFTLLAWRRYRRIEPWEARP